MFGMQIELLFRDRRFTVIIKGHFKALTPFFKNNQYNRRLDACTIVSSRLVTVCGICVIYFSFSSSFSV